MAGAGEFKALSVDTVRPYSADSVLLGKISLGKSRFLGAPDTSGGLHVTDTANSTSADTGAIRCAGGVGVAKTLWVGQKLTTASTNDVGDAGGASLAVGGDLAVDGYVTAAGGVSCDSTTASTSPSTGAVTVASGLTVLGGTSVGSTLVCASTGPAGSGASLKVDGDAIIGSDLVVGGGVAVSGFVDYRKVTVTGDLTVTSATASTDEHTGAITVGGGGLIARGAVTTTGSTAVAGTTTVSGASSFGGALHVTGALSTQGGVSAGSSLALGAGGATVAGAAAFADATDVAATTGGSLTVTGTATVAGQITVGSEVSLSADSNVYCDEQAPCITPTYEGRSILEYLLSSNNSLTITAPLPAGARPGGPVALVSTLYAAPSETTTPLDINVTVSDAWAVKEQALPSAFEHSVVKTLHIDPNATGQIVVLYSGTAPAATAAEDATLLVTISRGAGVSACVYFTEFWLRYVPQAWGSVTGGIH